MVQNRAEDEMAEFRDVCHRKDMACPPVCDALRPLGIVRLSHVRRDAKVQGVNHCKLYFNILLNKEKYFFQHCKGIDIPFIYPQKPPCA